MSKPFLFYSMRFMAVSALVLLMISVFLYTTPIIKVLSLILVPIIAGFLVPLSPRKSDKEMDELAIQDIDSKSVLRNSTAEIPLFLLLGMMLSVILLLINAYILPLSIENKIIFAVVVVATICLYPLLYQAAAAIGQLYAKTI